MTRTQRFNAAQSLTCRCFALLLALLLCGAVQAADSLIREGSEEQIKDKVIGVFASAGRFSGTIDNLVISPVVSYFTTRDFGEDSDPDLAAINRNERLAALFIKLAEGVVKVAYPELGIVIDGGKILIGGLIEVGTASVQIGEILADYHRGGPKLTAQKLIFGTATPIDDFLGQLNDLFRMHSFFGTYTPRLGIDAENVGQRVASEGELEDLFKNKYKAYLISNVFSLPSLRNEVQPALDKAWPHVFNYWKVQRASFVAARLEGNFVRAMRELEPLRARLRKEAAIKELNCSVNFTEPIWLEGEKKAICWCQQGYVWNAERSACHLEPAAQVRLLKCQEGAEPFWNAEADQAACRCKPGYPPDARTGQCLPPGQEQLAATTCQPGAEAYWDEAQRKPLCRCSAGLVWNRERDACVQSPQEQVAATRCQTNAQAYWNDDLQQVRCRCIAGHVWNEQRDACVADPQRLLALSNCAEKYPGSESYWNPQEQKVKCRCKTGTRFNQEKGACLADKPDPNLQKLLDDVAGNADQTAAAQRGERQMANEQREREQLTDHGAPVAPGSGSNPMEGLLHALSDAVVRSQGGLPLPERLPIGGSGSGSASASGGAANGVRPSAASAPRYSSEDIRRMQERLACLKEGRAKFSTRDVDCNGSYMIGTRDSNIKSLEDLLRQARAEASTVRGPAAAAPPPSVPRGAPRDDWFVIVASALPTSDARYRDYPQCRYLRSLGRQFVSSVGGGRREIEDSVQALRNRGYASVEVRYYDDSRAAAIAQQWDASEQTGRQACDEAVRRAPSKGK